MISDYESKLNSPWRKHKMYQLNIRILYTGIFESSKYTNGQHHYRDIYKQGGKRGK